MTPNPDGWTRTSAQRTRQVLIVDENEEVQHLCGYVVQESGMRAHTCRSPLEAYSTLAAIKIDFVVTNYDFFVHDGIDLIHHIRTNYANLHVLMLTPFNDTERAVQSIRGGASDYLMKPFSADEFRKKLRMWIQQRGPFSHWTRSQFGDIPIRRTLSGPHPIELPDADDPKYVDLPPSKQAAVFADAVRTILQITERDIEETALFFHVDEKQLRAAFELVMEQKWGSTKAFSQLPQPTVQPVGLTGVQNCDSSEDDRGQSNHPRLPFW